MASVPLGAVLQNNPADPVEAAARVGRALCRTAYWHEAQCNWVGRSSREMAQPGMPLIPTVTALGPDLYGGTAGISLFLAELHCRAPSPRLARTARGAIRQALAQDHALPVGARASFYSGSIGVAYAAARVGLLLDDAALVRDGVAAARRAALSTDGAEVLDVVGGNAGAIAPLLWLSKLDSGAALADFAARLAAALADRAIKTDDGWCWETGVASGKGLGPTPLCGYAHGASGMGLALIEIGVWQQRKDWVQGGLAAFAYEDRLFDAEARNWPDLRELQRPAGGGQQPDRPAMIAWCHGAAGIGLARLRAHRCLPERRLGLLPAIDQAIETTRDYLRTLSVEADASPCHGRAGLIELLLYAGDVLDRPVLRAEAVEAWRATVRSRRNMDWPCGVASGRNNPSLMLGYAGIGYALLRASAERVPRSILVVDPDD